MISVHMTTGRRHASGLLDRAVQSVLHQTVEDFELVICDDASTDGTAGYLDRLRTSDPRVTVIRNDRNVNSVALSLGRCLRASDAGRPFVTWMFDDCELRPRAFEALAERVSLDRSLDMVFGTTIVHTNDGRPFGVGGARPATIRKRIEESAKLVPNAAILVRRSLFETAGWYDPNVLLRRSCDWDFFRRVIRQGVRFESIGEDLCDEWGGQQPDSLRNSFTSTFTVMRKYVTLRDRSGWDLSLDAALRDEVDRIPPGEWTENELRLCEYMFLEYFLSVVDLERAAVWARRLSTRLEGAPFYLERIEAEGADDRAAMGAFCAAVWGACRAELAREAAELAARRRRPTYRLRRRVARIRRRLGQRRTVATGP